MGVWEYRVRVGDPETRCHRLTGRVQRIAGGGAIVFGTVQDVTDQREAEADRLAFEKKAQEAQKLEILGGAEIPDSPHVSHFLSKPFTLSELATAVGTLMDRVAVDD